MLDGTITSSKSVLNGKKIIGNIMRRRVGDSFFIMFRDEACPDGVCSREDGIRREGNTGDGLMQEFAAWAQRAEDVRISS